MIAPRNAWKDYMHEAGSFDKAATKSFDTYMSKYSSKAKETPKEAVDDVWFVPGKIYSFTYTTKAEPTPDRPAINIRPVMISMGQMESKGKVFEVGVDLMMVPFLVRVNMLDSMYRYFQKIIEDNEKNISSGRKGKAAAALTYENAKGVFRKLGWQMAFQTFDKTKIALPRIYDYSDWVSVVPLYTKGIRGMQMGSLYEKYIKEITKQTVPVTELSQLAKNK